MIDAVSGGGAPFLATGNGSGDSGSGFGGSAIWAIVLVALLGFGRGGRGGGDDCGGANAEINGRFNSIENQIDNLGNREDLARNLEAVCMTQRDVLEAKYDTSLQLKDMQMANAQCYAA